MIGNPNEKEAKLRVDKGGEYVVRLTVTDEDKTSTTDVTVTMTDAADGIQRVKTVITQVGVAPTLPNGVVAVRDDGTYSGGASRLGPRSPKTSMHRPVSSRPTARSVPRRPAWPSRSSS